MRGLAAVVAAAVGMAVGLVVPSAAWAAETTCTFYIDDSGCITGPMSANSAHKLYAKLQSYSSGSAHCWVRDTVTYGLVSELWITHAGQGTEQIITGVYATYFMTCVQPYASAGSGQAKLSNDSFLTS
jgi:hypothetical protein